MNEIRIAFFVLLSVACFAQSSGGNRSGSGSSGTVTGVLGTTNQITSDGNTTTPTLSLPVSVVAPGSVAATTGLTSGTNGGTGGSLALNGSTSGAATLSTNASGTNWQFTGNGLEIGDAAAYNFSQTNLPSGTIGAKTSVIGTGTTEAIDITAGTGVGLLNSGNRCNVNTAVSLSGATTICSWTLPNAAKIWGWQCVWSWNLTTLGTTPTLSVGMNAAQAPTSPGEVGSASIYTSNAGASTQANAVAFTTTGNNNILTSGSPAGTGSYRVETSGTINASATSGTFALTATLAGSGAVATVSGTCILY